MILATALLAHPMGCATVDPRPDFQRASALAAAASGYESGFEPGEEAAAAERAAELCADGLTLDEAVQVCLLNNPVLQAAFMEVGIARADVVQSGLFANPSLSLALQLPAGGGPPDLDADVAWSIVELWQLPIRKRAAERDLDQAVLALARWVAEAAFDTKVAYTNAVAARQLYDAARENHRLATALLEMTQARQQLGAGSAVDVNLSHALVLEEELAIAAAQWQRLQAGRSLARLLGLSIDGDDLVLSDVLPIDAGVEWTAEPLIELAIGRRLDAQAARSAVAAAEARARLEWRRVFPAVALGASLERSQSDSAGGQDLLADVARASVAAGRLTAPEIEPRAARDDDADVVVGPSLSLELPIFDQNQAQIAKALYALRQAARQLDALERALVQDVRDAVDRVRIARQNAELYQHRLLPLAEENVTLARDSYEAGKTSFPAVLEAQRLLLSARRRGIEARQTWAAALIELERTVGVPRAQWVEAA